MVKGWVGAAGRGVVGAAPLFEGSPYPGNWAYPDVPGMTPILDAGDQTHNLPTSLDRGVANWAYSHEPTTTPILDMGPQTRNPPTSFARGHSNEPFNAHLRGLDTRADRKIKRPWLWP